MTTLYELTTQLQALRDLDIDEQTLADSLEGTEGAIQVKAENMAKVMEGMQADILALKTEEKRLATRRQSLEARQKWLREYLRSNMEHAGITKISCPLFTISLAKPRPVASVIDEDALPDEYVVVTRRPDKRAILDALKAGLDVPGAQLDEGKPALMIR